MGFAALNPSCASMPAPRPIGAPRRTLGRDRVRCRRRDGVRARCLPMRRSRLRILRCQTAQFLRCRRVAASGFFAFPSFSQLPIPRPRGWRSAGRRYPLFCRARNRATPRLRGVGRPAQPGRRLTALHRDGFGPSPPLCASGVASGCAGRATLAAGCLRPVGRGSRTSRARFTSRGRDATSRSAFRIVSGDAPR